MCGLKKGINFHRGVCVLRPMLVKHLLETDHVPDFQKVNIIESNCKNYISRAFLFDPTRICCTAQTSDPG